VRRLAGIANEPTAGGAFGVDYRGQYFTSPGWQAIDEQAPWNGSLVS
jgi:hypothetical protein